MIFRIFLFVCGALLVSACGMNPEQNAVDVLEVTPTPRTGGVPEIEVLEPPEGAVVTSPFAMSVVTDNISLAPAGRTIDGEAHWHVMTTGGCLPAGTVIPNDALHLHVGSGVDRTEIDLPVGAYDLCVQLGDGFHVAIAVADIVRVEVVEG